MVVWINGPFGSGKTTLSKLLVENVDGAILFDPEQIGFLIHKSVVESQSADFQDFPMWRRIVVQFLVELNKQFKKPVVVPMTLVNSDYLSEVFEGLRKADLQIIHYFLRIDRATLEQRIQKQIMFPEERVKDQEVRQWRREQIDRCLSAAQQMPTGTIFLDSQEDSPQKLLEQVLATITNNS